jgi:methionyl aminopeptidase
MGAAISLKTATEIDLMLQANEIVAGTLNMLRDKIQAGVSTLQLDKWAEARCLKKDCIPAFKGYRGFPGSLCVSINEQVVHGIPSKKTILKEGDIISIDFGVKYKGFFGDAAVTIPVGDISPTNDKLLHVTAESLQLGIDQVVVGNRVNDISVAVQKHVESNGFSVVTQFVGHGIGRDLHESPEVPNYLRKGRSPRLMPGMVLAIEPMVNIGTSEVKVLKDGWTVVTADKKHSAHFEHSVLVTEEEPIILSGKIIQF